MCSHEQLTGLSEDQFKQMAQKILATHAASAFLSGDSSQETLENLRLQLKNQGIDTELYSDEESLQDLMLKLASTYIDQL